MRAVERPDFSFPNMVPGGDPVPDISFAVPSTQRREHAVDEARSRRLDADRAFATLGLAPGASMADVRAAYRWVCFGIDLERREGSPDAARKAVNAAYATLRLLAID